MIGRPGTSTVASDVVSTPMTDSPSHPSHLHHKRTLSEDVKDLGGLLGMVLREQAGEEAYALVEGLRQTLVERRRTGTDTADVATQLAALSSSQIEVLTRAFGLYFNLVNLAEEHERIRRRRQRTGSGGDGGSQNFDDAFQQLRLRGLSADEVETLVRETPLLLTFTAHPTEMRRRTVREHLDFISGALDDLGSDDTRDAIAAHIEALWATAELRERSPTVADEVTGGLRSMSILGEALADVDRDLRRAFERSFKRPLRATLPLGLHSWMGGDRDGNPNVTAEVTRSTLRRHRTEADQGLRAVLVSLFAIVSQHRRWLPADAVVDGAVEEPFRARVEAAVRALREDPTFDPLQALQDLEGALLSAGQKRTATTLLTAVRGRAQVLGRHLARLDVREHSEKVGAAVAWLFSQVGVADYATRSEDERRRLLQDELASARPMLGVGVLGSDAVPADVATVLDPLRVLREEAVGQTPYIVSMTDDVSDLLEVLIIAREAGARVFPVPLFETLKDLAAAPRVVDEFLSLPVYRRVLGTAVQEIMLGYSDSNKDAGPMAATFGLATAQRELSAVCRRHNVRWRFFHGRGTSLGRGGGPLARAILGQPPGTIDAGLRLTEQGEALADKYGHPALARRNLEQGLYGLLVAKGAPPEEAPTAFLDVMGTAAAASTVTYRELVQHPDFLRFFEAVTPIEEIARLKVASRPVRRPGAPTLSNLRAIPWVMSWTQNRANLPGWYGVDTAIDVVVNALGQDGARRMLQTWPAFRSMMDTVSMSLAKSDPVVFQAYLELDEQRSSLGPALLASRARTIALVEDLYQAPLLSTEPRLHKSIELRNPYIEPIHRAQVELLRRSRRGARGPVEDRALLATILGIAAGVRNAG